ncbi:ragulator complex protein LAMTOR1-like isoform X2 [Centruroides sculpturatus]|uniref:ragulator complex protein LAMTOR1-like isoform X2 n=1 Tax=Centruroides sculpturatus TaxID=218467 RepID=UPI000C6E9F20|nr:ragulator complex protein LAMTOR1-like isoform X2 [Centruroides sculpturatus]
MMLLMTVQDLMMTIESNPVAVPNNSEDENISSILKRVEENVIDIPALKLMEESRDFTDRVEKYSQQLNLPSPYISNEKVCLLEEVSTPEEVLSKNPEIPAENEKITKIVDKTLNALKEIKIEHKEELVVPFILT